MATHTVNVLSVCSGVGGLDLAVRLAVPSARTLLYVEREAWCVGHLVEAMEAGLLDEARVWSTLESLPRYGLLGKVDLLIAGLPCQPWSVAGKRRGHADERAIWPSFIDLVEACRPSLVFLENVPTFVTGGWFQQPGEELCRLGYEIEAPLFLRASDVGASQRRERVFVLAHRDGEGGLQQGGLRREEWRRTEHGSAELAHAEGARRRHDADRGREPGEGRTGVEPDSEGVAHANSRQLRDEPGRRGGEGRSSSAEPRDAVEAVGHTSRDDELRTRESRPRRAVPARGSGGDVEHTNRPRPQGAGPAEPPWLTVPWPPGPNDRDAWAAVLDRDPSLEPASSASAVAVLAAARRLLRLALPHGNRRSRGLQSRKAFEPLICRVADGSTTGLDSRIDRLRALGNMVVPLQGAVALSVLLRRRADGNARGGDR